MPEEARKAMELGPKFVPLKRVTKDISGSQFLPRQVAKQAWTQIMYRSSVV